MKAIKQALLALALAGAFTTANATPILNISTDGTLLGASGVNVGGTLYDVTFTDADFDSNYISPFSTSAEASAASSALFSQVLLGKYNTLALNTYGCSTQFLCSVETQYSVEAQYDYVFERWVEVVSALNYSTDSSDVVVVFTRIYGEEIDNVYTSPYFTRAIWTLSGPVAAVPESETYAMFLAGFGLLGAVSRRRKQKAAV